MRNLLKAIYFFVIVTAAVYCFKRPFYNWDMLPYSAVVLKMDGSDSKKAFVITYQYAKENIPHVPYSLLTDSANAYRYKLANSEEAFNEQLPFYAVKPLYTSLSYLAYKTGFPLPQAMLVPSFISYVLIGILLFHWLGFYLNVPASFFVSLLIMVSPPLIEVAKLSTPDCLSALLLLGSFYFIIEKPSLALALVCMCLSIFARIDNVIPCFLLMAAICVSKQWNNKLGFKAFFLITILFAVCYVIVGLIAREYGWSIFFYNNFAHRLHPTYGSSDNFNFKDYFRLMYEHIMSAINHSYIVIFMALHVLNLSKSRLSKKGSFDGLFAWLIPIILVVRFILYPDISDRFYVAYYLVIVVLLIRNFSPLLNLSPVPIQKDP